ncbi:uncharacterized protein LOC106175123 [Lingula anatina]|uniref:Uncharacterized protein LOC106175123 n=1 Tax=Lingula anatina TaxID=7574 RepID=A0A1S3JQJ3_LINAN|nr:uncharacterized protein LOC106175123 [Lingula anatina]XP_013412421.1 uncharacterized protein LOC106175123 [Lingula anatina]|eukprot:XP_013412419.1 uncharacterized protein LOC106175123 [Lingula anatina]
MADKDHNKKSLPTRCIGAVGELKFTRKYARQMRTASTIGAVTLFILVIYLYTTSDNPVAVETKSVSDETLQLRKSFWSKLNLFSSKHEEEGEDDIPEPKEIEDIIPTPMPGQPDIMITGPPRSGTTVIGGVVELAKETRTIHEPMNLDAYRDPCNLGKKPRVYRQLDIDLDVDLNAWKDYFNRFFVNCRNVTEGPKPRLVLKDPIALKYAEWLGNRYGLLIVVKVRHPGALLGSDCARASRWSTYVCTDDIVDRYIQMRHFQMQLLTEFYTKYKNSPNWYFMRHEAFCLTPVEETGRLFEFLKLAYTDEIKAEVTKMTAADNPQNSAKYKEIYLDAKSQIDNWKQRLTPSQILRIKNETQYYWRALEYSETTW